MDIRESIQEIMSILKCQRRLQPTTLKAYQCELNQLAAWLKNNYGAETTEALNQLSARQVEAFWQEEPGISVSSKQLRLSVTKRWITILQNKGIVTSKSVALFKPIQNTEAGYGNLSDYVGSITPKERLDTYQLCLYALLSHGLRVAEIQSISRSDFTPDYRRLIVTGKGRKQRLIIFDSESASVIMTHIHISNITGRLFNKSIPALRQQIKDLTIERTAPHDFRRHFATMAYRSEGSAKSIQAALGHDSFGTTEIYISKDAKVQGMMRDYKLAHPRA